MADRMIQTETLQSIANALRGGESQSAADKIEVSDFAEVAEVLQASDTMLKGLIERSQSSFEIPSGVTFIGKSAFYGYTNLRSVIIPEGVTLIGNNGFYGCTQLESVQLPNTLTKISTNGFYQAPIKQIYLPSSITEIGSNAFGIDVEVINCGFAQGAVSGAPWGAFNATINYNVSN